MLGLLTARYQHKIKTPQEIRDLIGPMPRKNKVVMCHGVFDVVRDSANLSAMQLGEGADIGAFTAEEALGRVRLTPYDAYALWMHHNRARIGTNV